MEVAFSIEAELGRIELRGSGANLLERPDFAELEALTRFLATPSLKAVVVAGAGRHFCGGADLGSLAQALADPAPLGRGLELGHRLLEAVFGATVPVVAAIRGQCLGAGLELALACHFRVGGSGSMYGFPEAKSGLLPGLGGTAPLGARPSRQTLIELILTGRLAGAEEALEVGLIDRLAPTAEVEAAAGKWLLELTQGRSHAQIRAVLEAVHNGRRLPRAEALRRETELFLQLAGERPR